MLSDESGENGFSSSWFAFECLSGICAGLIIFTVDFRNFGFCLSISIWLVLGRTYLDEQHGGSYIHKLSTNFGSHSRRVAWAKLQVSQCVLQTIWKCCIVSSPIIRVIAPLTNWNFTEDHELVWIVVGITEVGIISTWTLVRISEIWPWMSHGSSVIVKAYVSGRTCKFFLLFSFLKQFRNRCVLLVSHLQTIKLNLWRNDFKCMLLRWELPVL